MEKSRLNKFELEQLVRRKDHVARVKGMWVEDDGSVVYEVLVTALNKYKGWRRALEEDLRSR